MPAGNLTDEDLKHLLSLLGSGAQDAAIKAKIEADLPAPPPPPPAGVIDLKLTSDGGVEVAALPANAVADYAQATAPTGGTVKNEPKGKTVGSIMHPAADHPFVDAIARDLTTGKQVGKWYSELGTPPHGRLHVTAAPVEEPPKEEKPPVEEPPHAGTFELGLHAGNWGAQAPVDIAGTGVRRVRLPAGKLAAEAAGYAAKGVRIIGIFGEGKSLAGIAGEATSWARKAVEAGKTYSLEAIEVLNEPDGNWFWSDAGNVGAIKTITKAVHDQAQALGYTGEILASFDGGKGGGEGIAFGKRCQAEGVFAYATGVTVHPYGGSSGGNGGSAGDRKKCNEAIAVTKLPVWATETGWPTGTGSTGDSQSWTEAQQAANYASFIAYAEATPGFKCVIFYGYKNTQDSGADQYGVELHDSSRHKPAFGVLGEACKALDVGAKAGEHLEREAQVGLHLPFGHLEDDADRHERADVETYGEAHRWTTGQKMTPQELADFAEAA